jgi:NADPH-dependent 2,4-dienoyl-CoA reductase/sulfur reductase-like enzyme
MSLLLAADAFQIGLSFVFHLLTANYFKETHSPPSPMIQTMKNIVILGGNFGGVSTAHRILKQAAKTGPFKITLVSPESHFYWSLASPRAIIPGQITDDELFQPTAVGFNQYPSSQFEFILGSAETLDVASKEVEISGPTGRRTLGYDFLILATGSRIDGDVPFKGRGSTEATKDALHAFQARVEEAETIVVAGAGATGVEVAGELGFEYGLQKEIILVSLASHFGVPVYVIPPRYSPTAFPLANLS